MLEEMVGVVVGKVVPSALVCMVCAAGVVAVACGGTAVATEGDDVPSRCVGSYSGTYSGDARGSIEGRLASDRSFSVTFRQTTSETSYTVSGRIDEDGAIDINQGSALTGTFNFNRCSASGQWTTGPQTGRWNASLE
jgi:hypothetical protein